MPEQKQHQESTPAEYCSGDKNVSAGGRTTCRANLRFANDIDALAEEEPELETLCKSLDKICAMYKMEISAETAKLMTNSANCIQREIKVGGRKLGTSLKYLGANCFG